MKKQVTLLIIGLVIFGALETVTAEVTPGDIESGSIQVEYRNVTVYAPAVGQTISGGYVGILSTLTITIQSNGSGRVFVDTLPLAEIDMQGSARLAVKVASALVRNDINCSVNPNEYDYFFVIRTDSPIIGGPSAGAVMTTAVVSLLEDWEMDNETVMTGMINPDASVGPIGGITYKVDAAASIGAKRFLIPKGQNEYTEVVTETSGEGWWQQITTRTITRNVSDYAMDNYGIEVVEVEDINDALLYFTGHMFPTSEGDGNVSTEEYQEAMQPLAEELLVDAQQSFENASALFDEGDIPNVYPNYYRNQVTDFLNAAEDRLLESETWLDEDLYYSSTSKSFQSLINSNVVRYACEYFSTDNSDGYLDDLLSDISGVYETNSILAKNANVTGMVSLQCVGAAQKRASEAELYLQYATVEVESGDWLQGMYDAAFALERSRSVGWWLNISTFFNESGMINDEEIDDLAQEYIEDAQQQIIYSEVILSELGTTSSYITEAEQLLASAEQNREEGYPSAALFEALESLARANLALELVDGDSVERYERYRESAAAGISEARGQGFEPVLAVSYYEFGESLGNTSMVESAMVYFKYSDLITGVLTLSGSCSSSDGSRYVGIPEVGSYQTFGGIGTAEAIGFIAVLGGLAGIVGIAIGFVIGAWFRREEMTKFHEDSSTTNSQEKKSMEHDEELPENLHQYYR